MRLLLGAALAAALALPASASALVAAPFGPETTPGVPRTPIRHVISLMQEGHSFDNYFGTYPGADGIAPGTCMPYSTTNPRAGCVEPFRIGGRAIEGLNHASSTFRAQYEGGRMNGFVAGLGRATGTKTTQAMGHYDDRDIPYYWNVADSYTLFDRFFASARAGGVPNHMYWTTGTPGDPHADGIPKQGYGDLPTIFDRLQRRGISWKFYVQNYDPQTTFRTRTRGDRRSQLVGVPLLNYARYVDDPRLFAHIVPLEQYYEDLRRGTLPAVSYVAPSGSSEHAPGSIQAGQTLVRTMVNALMRSDAWSSSALTWTYDGWGGWYDHVRPPQVDRHGYGFRVPALLVSAWSRRGYVSHATLDFTSILRFIEDNWALEPLASRDRRAQSIADAFDFTAGPREPALVSSTRAVARAHPPRRMVVVVAYSEALLLVLAVIGLAALRDRRRARRPGQPEGETA